MNNFRGLKIDKNIMTVEEFYEELSHVNASRESRLKYANKVLDDRSLFPSLLDILFMADDKVSCRAAWVFEFVCTQHIYHIIPHLELFTKNLKKIHFDSAVRPVAKVCQLIANTYCGKKPNPIKKLLTHQQQQRIVEAAFDWMISDQKVAAKVYTMETLYLFGTCNYWIHEELAQIIEQDFYNQSAGYKARAKHILKRIKAKNKK
ncbi:adenylosuccinate lyase [Litoribaculum gwangyangense]|uniref:Adenylosuccinate lyase n=1 Tax=Litoribaculum gwangyangense TaxID=1130722 RepID=A0ABP9CYZ0_9FLAO